LSSRIVFKKIDGFDIMNLCQDQSQMK